MDIGSILVILALLLLVAAFVSRPLLERSSVAVSQEEQEHSTLLAERDRLISALQELDFDHELGKIPEDIYSLQRTNLVQRGADVLRQLDTQMEHTTSERDLDVELEKAIAARRAESTQTAAAPTEDHQDDEIETLIAMRRRSRQEKAGGFCPHCGGPVQKSDRFCPKCGGTL
jgi:rubrerythrin